MAERSMHLDYSNEAPQSTRLTMTEHCITAAEVFVFNLTTKNGLVVRGLHVQSLMPPWLHSCSERLDGFAMDIEVSSGRLILRMLLRGGGGGRNA